MQMRSANTNKQEICNLSGTFCVNFSKFVTINNVFFFHNIPLVISRIQIYFTNSFLVKNNWFIS